MDALRGIVGIDLSDEHLLSLLNAAEGSVELAANMHFEGKSAFLVSE